MAPFNSPKQRFNPFFSLAPRLALGHAALLLIGAIFAFALPAHASDGVIEVNQACAEHAGCFAGDAPGFPVTITPAAGRNFRLTSDLNVSASVSAIEIEQDGVNVDLNGFALIGPVSCSGDPGSISCAPVTDGTGILGPHQIVVTNGRIEGFSSVGLRLSSGRVEKVIATGNAGGGIIVRDIFLTDAINGSLVLDSTASLNRGNGMHVANATVSRSVVYGNGGYGILGNYGGAIQQSDISKNGFDGMRTFSAEDRWVVAENRIHGNGGYGLYIGFNSRIKDNAITGNTDGGIRAGAACTISGNAVHDNEGDGIWTATGSLIENNTSSSNDGHGISTSEHSSALNNVMQLNSDFALFFRSGTASHYRGNLISSTSDSRTVGFFGAATALNRGANTCNGSAVCP